MPVMTGGQSVVRALQREGVEVVFGVPGAQIMRIYDGLFDARDIRVITVRHEQAAGFMADGYARTMGKPGVAMVVPGPGAYNVGAALATAYATSSPVFLLAGQVPSSSIGKDLGPLHDIHDQLEILKPVTKWNQRVLRVEDIPGAVHEAFRQMATGRPRPVEIEIPPDILGGLADVEVVEPEPYLSSQPGHGDIAEAADLLATAVRPLIWAGGGVNQSGAWDELREVAELLGAPVIVTAEGKGGFSEAHPLSVGSTSYGWGATVDVVPEADVILAVGSRFAFSLGTRFASRGGADWAPQPHQKLVNINVDPGEFGKTFPASVGIAADARPGLAALAVALTERQRHSTWGEEELAAIRSRSRERMRAAAPQQIAMADILRSSIPEDAIVIQGLTMIAAWCSIAFPVTRPRTFITSGYMGTLGAGFPTALGAKVGNPDRTVVALVGDGGFMYTAAELATAVQYGINVVTVVFNNHAYGASKVDQESQFQGRLVGTELHNPDFAQLAESFGALGMRVGDFQGLPEAVSEAIAADRPTVIEVETPPIDPPYQMLPPSR